MKTNSDFDKKVIASVKGAIIGGLDRSAIRVEFDWDNTSFKIRSIHEGEITEDRLEELQVVTTEIAADIPEFKSYLEECFTLEETNSLPQYRESIMLGNILRVNDLEK